jgi:hypothetical protein
VQGQQKWSVVAVVAAKLLAAVVWSVAVALSLQDI